MPCCLSVALNHGARRCSTWIAIQSSVGRSATKLSGHASTCPPVFGGDGCCRWPSAWVMPCIPAVGRRRSARIAGRSSDEYGAETTADPSNAAHPDRVLGERKPLVNRTAGAPGGMLGVVAVITDPPRYQACIARKTGPTGREPCAGRSWSCSGSRDNFFRCVS